MGRGEKYDANAFEAAYAGWLADGAAPGRGEEAPQRLRAAKKPAESRLSVVTVVSYEEPSAEAQQRPREILF